MTIDEPPSRRHVIDEPATRRFSSLIDERLKAEHSVSKPRDTTYPKKSEDVIKVDSINVVIPRQQLKAKSPEPPAKAKSPALQPEIPDPQAEVKIAPRKAKVFSLSGLVESKVSKSQPPVSSQDDIPGN